MSSRSWPPRASDTQVRDVYRAVDQVSIEISTLETWRTRIMEAIRNGFVTTTNGERRQLDETSGIDILANLVERSRLSVNPDFYG